MGCIDLSITVLIHNRVINLQMAKFSFWHTWTCKKNVKDSNFITLKINSKNYKVKVL